MSYDSLNVSFANECVLVSFTTPNASVFYLGRYPCVLEYQYLI